MFFTACQQCSHLHASQYANMHALAGVCLTAL